MSDHEREARLRVAGVLGDTVKHNVNELQRQLAKGLTAADVEEIIARAVNTIRDQRKVLKQDVDADPVGVEAAPAKGWAAK